jgi:cholest-4-en-3-one 26-monooxygenase
MTTLTAADIAVLDPDTYANGDPTTFGLPLDQYAFLHAELPVCRQEFNDPRLVPEVWILSRHQDITQAEQDTDSFSADGLPTVWAYNIVGEEVGAPGILVQDGEQHRDGRRVISGAFTPKVVETLAERFRRHARRVIDHALALREPFDFVSAVAHEMPMQALGDILGVPDTDRPRFFGWVDTFSSAFDERIAPTFDDVLRAISEIHEYSVELRDLKRSCPAGDVVTRIAESRMGDPEVRGNVTLLACGAAESTRNALSHGLHELMRQPDQMRWLRDRADDIPPQAVQEIVRIACPFTHMTRWTRREVDLHGTVIPAGKPVAMLWAAGNFDETVIPNPNRFDLSRSPNQHMSFGRGEHSCVGKHIASLEIKILLEELLQRTSEIRPAGPISYVRDNYSRSVYELPVEFIAA